MTLDSSCSLIAKSMTSARSSFGEAQEMWMLAPRSSHTKLRIVVLNVWTSRPPLRP